MHVVVIGAGLGGLALAQGLRRAGISVAVYERDATSVVRNQGYRIRIDPNGIAALRAVLSSSAYDVFAATAGTPGGVTATYDHELNLLHRFEQAPVPGLPGGGNLAVNRQTLREILLAGLDGVVRFGARFTRFESGPDSVTAHFEDGSVAVGDVLVGADGAGSMTRQQLLPEARVVDAGLRLLYGKAAFGAEELLGLWTTVVGPEKRFVGLAPVRFGEAPGRTPGLSPVTDYLTCVFGARVEEFPCSDLFALSGSELRAVALAMTDGWHPAVREVLAGQDAIFPVTVRSSVPIGPWETSRVTLLGDAIHVMSPAIGVGANTALRDGQVLAARIREAAGGRPVVEALREYEAEMVGYGFDAVRDSARRGHELVGQNPLEDAT
ncbi:FAD-dependent monooxygenase [Kribbella sp. NBC_00482]|uniref:FAD-dependent oxidoreductase n=1 Tax=Kribbella sp. NBC_00482 TaxID=2975968 RepID=UPI002E190BE9